MKVRDLIADELISGTIADTAGSVEEIMHDNGIHALPIIDEMRGPLGIVTSSDLDRTLPEDTPVTEFMGDHILEIGLEDGPGEAAKLMRDQGVHHLFVTEEGRVVGILSSFDLLKVIEEG